MCEKCIEEDDSLTPEEKAEKIAKLQKDSDHLDQIVKETAALITPVINQIIQKYPEAAGPALTTALAMAAGKVLQSAPEELLPALLPSIMRDVVNGLNDSRSDGKQVGMTVVDPQQVAGGLTISGVKINIDDGTPDSSAPKPVLH